MIEFNKNTKKIAITGITGKTITAWTLNDALIRQGFNVLLSATWNFHYNNELLVKRKLTNPTISELMPYEEYIKKCDFFIFEATSRGISDFRIKTFCNTIDVAILTHTNGFSTHEEEYESREQYLNYKSNIFSSFMLNNNGIAVFPYDTEIYENIIKILETSNVKVSNFYGFDPIEVCNLTLNALGLKENSKKVKVKGRYEKIDSNIIVDKCTQLNSVEWTLKESKEKYPNKDIVVVYPYYFNRLKNNKNKIFDFIISQDSVKKLITYEQHTQEGIPFTSPKLSIFENREMAIKEALKEDPNCLILFLGNGDQELNGETDQEILNRLSKNKNKIK